VGALPNPGGIFQQIPSHIRKLEKVYQARNKFQSDDAGKKTEKRKSDTDEPGPDM
jgi:hypothetical protein